MGESTVYSALLRQAERSPGTSTLFIGGRDWSRQELLDTVTCVGAGLRELGLDRGDRAAIIADNRSESVTSWLGANAAGFIDVPINSEARGSLLNYLIHDAAPRVLIGQPDYLRRLADVLPSAPEHVVVIEPDEGDAPFGSGVSHLSFEELLALGKGRSFTPPREDEIATMIYTSGTTGPSKGVMLPQGYHTAWANRAIRVMGMQPGETAYTVQPLFHSDARSYVVGCLLAGGRAAVGSRFSVSRFWDQVREVDATYIAYLGTLLSLLYSAPEKESDRDHPARIAVGGGAPAAIHRQFEDRFGVKLLEMYGMTEALAISMNSVDRSKVGSVGLPSPDLEVQLVDATDRPVPVGEVGELVLRPRKPHITMAGYWAKPEATVAAWRNLWLHTGDTMRADEDGYLYYVGRLKDSIRRRGENVSCYEVEMSVMKHPDVLEAAAIGVPSPLGEEDVAIIVSAREGHSIDPAALREFLQADLPRYAVPRYIEVVDALPKTPTERVNKDAVRQRGITAAAWDAENAVEVTQSGAR